jgi:hypothetical protein
VRKPVSWSHSQTEWPPQLTVLICCIASLDTVKQLQVASIPGPPHNGRNDWHPKEGQCPASEWSDQIWGLSSWLFISD